MGCNTLPFCQSDMCESLRGVPFSEIKERIKKTKDEKKAKKVEALKTQKGSGKAPVARAAGKGPKLGGGGGKR